PNRMSVLSATISRPSVMTVTFSGPLAPTDYEAVMGVQSHINPTLYATATTNRSVMFRDSKVKLIQVPDGTSNTIALVECGGRPRVWRGQMETADQSDQGQGWIDAEGAFSLDGANAAGVEKGPGQNYAMNVTNTNEPYGFHRG